MHKYMRAIGFSEYTDRKKLKELLTDVIMNSDHRAYTMNQEGILLGEFSQKSHKRQRGRGIRRLWCSCLWRIR